MDDRLEMDANINGISPIFTASNALYISVRGKARVFVRVIVRVVVKVDVCCKCVNANICTTSNTTC